MSVTDLLKKKVEACYGLVEFTYRGKYGNIDPYFHKDGTYSYLLYFDGFEKVMNEELSEFGDLSEKILRIGYVDDEDLSALYSGAEVFLFPSLYEGFGIPVLEAMQCGLPVICSNCTSIPEVIGDCGIQINPHNDEEMVSAMEKMSFDKPFYDECAQKGMERAKLFTWQKCGDIMDQKIQGVLSGV